MQLRESWGRKITGWAGVYCRRRLPVDRLCMLMLLIVVCLLFINCGAHGAGLGKVRWSIVELVRRDVGLGSVDLSDVATV